MPPCEICGSKNAQKHHIVPKHLHGESREENYSFLCWKHHTELHRLTEKLITNTERLFKRELTTKEKGGCYIKAYLHLKIRNRLSTTKQLHTLLTQSQKSICLDFQPYLAPYLTTLKPKAQ